MNFLGLTVHVFYSPTKAQSGSQDVQTPNASLSRITYNSIVTALCVLADALSKPQETAQAQAAQQELATATYHGSIKNQNGVPFNGTVIAVYGSAPRPTDAERSIWWDALGDIAHRMFAGVQAVTSSTPGINARAADERLVGLLGPCAIAAIPSNEWDDAKVYTLPVDVAQAWAPVIGATVTYINRLQAIANGSTAAAVTQPSALETQVRPLIQALAADYQTRAKRALWMTAGAAALGGGGGAIAGGMMGRKHHHAFGHR